ncbi:EamA family transporter [Methanohalophilus sp.]|uniref:EamA family transporter n=1 Tax=Methanohalophilus sp. TaxID=1966352 RepID=UPI0026292980|nr:EamA family transporter [Methanohalophilus sp.]MDK2892196.1 hypothetical protein [Methanohalophilus sp.]
METLLSLPAEILVVILGIAAAASWGAADFGGGVAAKRASEYIVVVIMQAVGAVLLLLFAIFLSENIPALNNVFWGFLAGISGSLGLIVFYRGLSRGHMGVVAPLSAVVAVILPVIHSAFYEGIPATHQIFGFLIAIVGIWLIAGTTEKTETHFDDITLALLSGFGFGLFFIFIAQFSGDSLFWPLVIAKLAAVVLLLLFLFIKKSVSLPSSGVLPIIIVAGIFDTFGILLFTLATQIGRLDIATVTSCLYPGGTVLLAWFILKEHISPKRWAGVVLALIALMFILL